MADADSEGRGSPKGASPGGRREGHRATSTLTGAAAAAAPATLPPVVEVRPARAPAGPRNPTYDISRARTPLWSFTRRGQPSLGGPSGRTAAADRQGPGSYDPRMGIGRSTDFGRGSERFRIPGYVPDKYLGPGHYGIVKTIRDVFSKHKKYKFTTSTRAQAGAASGSTEALLGQSSPGPKYKPACESMALHPDGPTARFGNNAPRGSSSVFSMPASGSIGPGDYTGPNRGVGQNKPMAGLGYATRDQAAMATGVVEQLMGSQSPGPGRYNPRPNKDSRWKTSQKWTLNTRDTVEAYDRHQGFWRGLEPSPADTIFTTFQGPRRGGKQQADGGSRRSRQF